MGENDVDELVSGDSVGDSMVVITADPVHDQQVIIHPFNRRTRGGHSGFRQVTRSLYFSLRPQQTQSPDTQLSHGHEVHQRLIRAASPEPKT